MLGYSEAHSKIITFRVDRMGVPKLLPDRVRPKPADFDPVDYTVNVFSMYDGQATTVRLLCKNHLMNYVLDRFGDEVKTEWADAEHFIAEVEVSVSQTFFAWVFQFAGAMKLLSPEQVKEDYQAMLRKALE